jgi:integrase/recombinase XerD
MSELNLWRRHLRSCHERAGGRSVRNCGCPVWVDGRSEGKRIRHSMGTANWDRAQRKLDRMLDPDGAPREVKVSVAVAHYLDDCETRKLAESTVRSYRKTLGHFQEFCSHEAYPNLSNITLEALTAFRSSRKGRNGAAAKSSTLRKEIECLRAFSAFAQERGWMEKNLAKKLKPPKESTPATLPFEPSEVTRILEACAKIGNREHALIHQARVRIRAFILLLLYSGLRISDACALKRPRLNPETGHLTLRQMKTGAILSVKLPDSLVDELLKLPGEYFFWTGKGAIATAVGNLRQTISSVLRIAKVIGHPHRFRDTFAVSLLEQDVPIRTVQLLLGHSSVRTTEKHYAPFVRSQQRLLDAAVQKLDFGEGASQAQLPEFPLKKRVRNAKRYVRASA